jgi:hypothetical protein
MPAEEIMTTLHRSQLLLEATQHEALADIAKQEGRSISDLVREIVGRHLAERDRQAQSLRALQAIDRLSRIRTRLQEEHGLFPGEPLAELREEWEEHVERIWRDEP